MTALRRILLAILLLIPLIAGTVYATVTKLEPAATWSEEPAAAPSTADLIPARRAAGEASSQAGLLTTGTGELAKGAGELADGTGKLAQGATSASQGSGELAKGMEQLQAGTGQLGDGAVKVADGVSKAVEQVQGIGLVQSQIVAEIDKVDAELAKKKDPQAAEVRKQLGEFKNQVQGFKLDGALVDQMAQLRSGSREIANQLTVPGYGYHDGIYSATKGAKDLAAGLTELDKGLAAASQGAGALKDGAVKIDGMAKTNKDKVSAVQRALPADTVATPSEPAPQLIPLFGFLIALAVMLGSVFSDRWRWLIAAGIGSLLVVVLSTGLTAVSASGLVAVLILSALASALFSNAVVALFGPRVGCPVVYGLFALQAGLVGWVWKQASVSSVPASLSAASGMLPLNYATTGLSAYGNNGSLPAIIMSFGVLIALAVAGAFVVKVVPDHDA